VGQGSAQIAFVLQFCFAPSPKERKQMIQALLSISMFVALAQIDTVAEETAVRAFLATRQDAFNRGDAKWLVGHFTQNAEHIDSTGRSVKGKDKIEKAYRALFDVPGHKDVKTIQKIEEIRCVTADVAVVNASWSLSGLKNDKGKPLPDRNGRSIIVVVKKDGEWMIDLLRADLKVHSASEKPVKVDGE
jgi:uncharacterized protein (TIGR02246 family)